MTARSRLASRLTRDASIYAAGSFAVLALGLVNLAVLTRMLTPSEFGLLATALVVAEILPLIYNMGSLQGGIGLAFGASGDDEGDADEDLAPHERRGSREALGTALVLTAAIAAVGTLVAVGFAGQLASAVLGDEDHRTAIVLAAATGGVAALFRFTSLIPRYEYKAVRFAVLHAGRVALALLAAIPFVAFGLGVDGALAGALVGTALATVASLALTHRHYSARVSWRLVPRIYARGRVLVPVNISFWIVRNADVLVLAQFVRARDIGVYRVASRAGGLMAFPVSAFLMSWSTLSRQPIHAAVAGERGPEVLASRVVTYFVLATTYLALALGVASELLVRIAGPGFRDAAALIPFVGLGFMAHGVHIAIYRAARFPAKRRVYVLTAVGSALVFLAAALVLVPAYGIEGAVAAGIAAPASAAIVIFVLSQRGPHPIPFEYGRIARAVGIAAVLGACTAVVQAVGARLARRRRRRGGARGVPGAARRHRRAGPVAAVLPRRHRPQRHAGARPPARLPGAPRRPRRGRPRRARARDRAPALAGRRGRAARRRAGRARGRADAGPAAPARRGRGDGARHEDRHLPRRLAPDRRARGHRPRAVARRRGRRRRGPARPGLRAGVADPARGLAGARRDPGGGGAGPDHVGGNALSCPLGMCSKLMRGSSYASMSRQRARYSAQRSIQSTMRGSGACLSRCCMLRMWM